MAPNFTWEPKKKMKVVLNSTRRFAFAWKDGAWLWKNESIDWTVRGQKPGGSATIVKIGNYLTLVNDNGFEFGASTSEVTKV